MAKVAGKDVLALIFFNGQWRNYACGISCSLDVTTEFIETSTRGSGKSKTFIPAMDEFTGSIDGMMALQEPGLISLPDFRDIQDAQLPLMMRYQHTDEAGNIYTEECNFYISRTSDTGASDGIATFNVGLRGTGARTRIYTSTATTGNPTMRLQYTGIGGEISFTDTTILGKNVFQVTRDGLDYSKLITSGTPINKEVKFDITTGTIEFSFPLSTDEEVVVYYQ